MLRDQTHIDNPITLGARLQEERLRIGFEEHDLAHAGGKTITLQKRCEKGTAQVPVGYLQLLAHRTDIDLLYIMTGERGPHNVEFGDGEASLLENFRGMSQQDQTVLTRLANALVLTGRDIRGQRHR